MVKDKGLMPQSGRSPRGGHGNPSISLPGESDGQKNVVVYSPEGRKDSDKMEVTENKHESLPLDSALA